MSTEDFRTRAIRRMQQAGMITPEARDRMLAHPAATDPHSQIGEWQALLSVAIWPIDSFNWTPDHDDPESVDDMFAKNVNVRMERMDNGHYWMAIHLSDGTQHDFDLTSKRKIRAFARQPAPVRVDVCALPVNEEMDQLAELAFERHAAQLRRRRVAPAKEQT